MKKKCIFPVAVAAIMLVPLLALAAGPLNRISYMATYNYNNLTVGSDTLGGVTYATVSYNGLYNGGEPGMPSLPIDYLKFSVPYNATNFTVTASGGQWTNRNLDYMVYPCQAPRFTDAPAPPIMLPDTSAYFSGNPYPSQMAWVVDEGFLAGENHIVTVAVMPLRYSHSSSTDILSGARRCNLILSYDLSDSLAISPIIRNDSLLREEGYQLTQSIVVNPNKVKNFAPTQTLDPTPGTGFIQGGIGGNEINGGGYGGPEPIDSLLPPPGVDTTGISTELILNYSNYYPYLIVTTPELKHSVRRIAALKRQKGYNVKVVTMDEVIPSAFAGSGDVVGEGSNAQLTYTDPAGKLRQFIRNYYKFFGTKYVLLVGTDVPYRTTTHILDSRISKTFQSDLYFSDLTADWTTGQFDKDPELFVGRILASCEEQIYNYTDKLFRYELNPGKGDYNYIKNAFYSQSYDMKDFNNYTEEVDIIRNALDSIYLTPSIMMEPELITDGIPYPSGEDIVNELNSTPYSYLSLHHHGCPSSLLTCGKIDDNRIIPPISFLWSNNNELVPSFDWRKNDTLPELGLNNLSNKYYPSICFSISCETMPFLMPSYYVERGLTMSFGESFTTGKDYGGPVYIGNTDMGWTPDNAYVELKFAERINDGHYKIGEANSYGKLDYDSFFKRIANYVVAVQNQLGDPSLELWTDIPQVYENISVTRNDNGITINGINSQPADIAIIGINGNIIKTAATSDVTLNDVSPNSTITLYKHNSIPFIVPLILQKININRSQYVIASDVTAGRCIDSNRSYGDVIVKNGVEFEIETSGTVTLEDGFNVEKGATFAIYPSCF